MIKIIPVPLHEVFDVLNKEIERLRRSYNKAFMKKNMTKSENLGDQINALKDIGKELEKKFL